MKTIIAFLFFILPCIVNAQLKKGQWLIGGIADFSHGSSNEGNLYYDHDSKVTNYRFMPGTGYFFADKFCGGLRINISKLQTKEITGGAFFASYTYSRFTDLTVSGIGLSPFLRYYFLPASKKVNLFADGSYTYNSEKSKAKNYETTTTGGGTPVQTESSSKSKYKGNYYSVAAGPALFIGQNVMLELSIGYTVGKVSDIGRTSDRISFGTGFQVQLGK